MTGEGDAEKSKKDKTKATKEKTVMPSYFCLSVTLLDAAFHGRRDDGVPEWPPSPLRAFQALVAAAAARWREPQFSTYAVPALEWLERLDPPDVLAPVGRTAPLPHRLYVPNNASDLVTKAWASGNTEASIASHRTAKDVRPTRLAGDVFQERGNMVRFVWRLSHDQNPEVGEFITRLSAAALSITHLGWGLDMAAGHAAVVDEPASPARLPREPQVERWTPSSTGTPLRVPLAGSEQEPGTLRSLVLRHDAFTRRMMNGKPRDMPSLTAFRVIEYARDTDPARRPWAAFRIASVDPDAPNPSFNTPNKCRDVAAWIRHAVAEVCKGWPFPDFASFVHGHDDNGKQVKGEDADRRFMYLPLPTINHPLNRVESIRRVLIAAPAGCGDRIDWLNLRLPGQELEWDGKGLGVLISTLPASDWVRRQYTDKSRVWSTVTPVVWPGHDDHDSSKAERVLRKAFVDAGISQKLVDDIVELEWRPVGFRAGLDLASRYERPEKLNGRQYHVRVRFPHPIRGPLAVGAGRYRGLGLFATESD